jgi:hypothetical protein
MSSVVIFAASLSAFESSIISYVLLALTLCAPKAVGSIFVLHARTNKMITQGPWKWK